MPAGTDRRNRTPLRLARGVAVLALGLGAVTGCGSDSTDDTAAASTSSSPATGSDAPLTTSPSGEAESITATEADFSISLDEDTLTAGSYQIEVVNDGDATHDLAVEQGGTTIAKSDGIQSGDSTTLTVDLAPGQYVFYCSIGNHRAMGMELTVQVT